MSIKQPLVSIIVPVYNAEEYILDCLFSIQNQGYRNIEVIVVDDVSNDNTKAVICEENLITQDNRFKIIFNEVNLGATKNCNKALSYCTGSYVCFFAGDDVMLAEKLELQVAALENDLDASLCYHNVDIFDGASGDSLALSQPKGRTVYSFIDVIKGGGLPGANSVMCRSNLIPSGFYDERLPRVSDWKMFIEISVRGKILYLDRVLARYRKHSLGLSKNATSMLEEYFYTLDLVCERFSRSMYIKSICYFASERFILGSIVRELKSNGGLDLLSSKIEDYFVPLSKFLLVMLRVPFVKSLLQFILTLFLKQVSK